MYHKHRIDVRIDATVSSGISTFGIDLLDTEDCIACTLSLLQCRLQGHFIFFQCCFIRGKSWTEVTKENIFSDRR